MKQKPIYLFSHKITYKRFYKVWKLYPHGTIVPQELIKGKLIWEMVRDGQLFLYVDPQEAEDPLIFASKLPNKREILIMK